MIEIFMKKNILISLLTIVLAVMSMTAQENAQIYNEAPKTLFPYPQAPDTIRSFQERANYVVTRFWDNFDVSKPIQDESAFDMAFQDYLDFFPHAHKTVVVSSIRGLMNKAQSNKANYILIGKLAEKNIYSPQAVFASDEAYLLFVEEMIKSSVLKKKEKKYYKEQIKKINQNTIGALCPELNVVNVDGEKMKLKDLLGDKVTLLFFNDGECTDCMMARLRLSTNVDLNGLIANGEMKVICVVPKKYTSELASEIKKWADNWTIVTAENVAEVFDLRLSPSIFILNNEKKIEAKNVPIEALIR